MAVAVERAAGVVCAAPAAERLEQRVWWSVLNLLIMFWWLLWCLKLVQLYYNWVFKLNIK